MGDDDGGGSDDEASLFEDSLDVHGIDWIVVFAYFDETGMHGAASEVVVAGYLFSKDGVKRFKNMVFENVMPLLPANDDGEKVFHASKCLGWFGYDEYSSLALEARQHIGELIVNAIKLSAKLGLMVGMEKKEYEKAIFLDPALRDLAGDKYSVCLVRCMENLAGWLKQRNIQGRIEYIFEAGCEHQKEANEILFSISKSPILRKRYRLHNYRFADKGPELPQLFAPDLLAWEYQRWHGNQVTGRKEERSAMRELTKEEPHPPHIYEYQDAKSVRLRALINFWYGITKRSDGKTELSI